jgi:hypothetical protein
MRAEELLQAKVQEHDLLSRNLKKLESDLVEAERGRREAEAALALAETGAERSRLEQTKFHSNFAFRKARESIERDSGPLRERIAALDRELPGLRHQAEREAQEQAAEAYAVAARAVSDWFDQGVALARALDEAQQRALNRWPRAVMEPGQQALPPGAGIPSGPTLALEAVFGSGDHRGVCGAFKQSILEWNPAVLAQTDAERIEFEHARRVEFNADQMAKELIAQQNKAAFAALPGVRAQTVAAPPPRYGKIVGTQAPAIPPTAAPLEDQELDRLRVELGKASADYVNVGSAHYRKEASDEAMAHAREQLQKAEAAFAAREREIASPAERAAVAIGPSWAQ